MDDKEIKENVEFPKKKSFLNNKKTVSGKALSAWLITMIVIFMLFTFGLGLFLGKELFSEKTNKKKNDNNKDNEVNENVNVKKELNDSIAISKLEKFVKVASYNNAIGDGIEGKFMTGTSDLTKKDKLQLTYQSLISISKIMRKIGSIPDKYKNDDHFDINGTEEITIKEFDDEYKLLFNENPNYNDVEIEGMGCPAFYKVDRELGKIFIGRECGGTGYPEVYYKIYKYEEDKNYYYVYQYVAKEDPVNNTINKYKSNEVVNVQSFDGNEDKFETVIWKFDKNYNFVSTENIG